jgi:hypothetical protein
MANTQPRYRRWAITWNNWQDHFRFNASPESIVKKLSEQSGILHQYIIVGKEIAPETNKSHLQIYVEYTHQATFEQMKQRFPGAHIENAFGIGYKNVQYCKKGNDWYEEGEVRSRKLSQEDIASNVVDLLNEMRPTQIAERYPEYAMYVVRNYKSLCDIYLDKQTVGNYDPKKEVPF